MKKSLFILVLVAAVFLTACSNYNQKPEYLTPELEAKFDREVAKWDAFIKNPALAKPQQNTQSQQGTQTQTQTQQTSQQEDPRAPLLFYVNKAVAQENLGKLDDAMSTYNEAQRVWGESQVVLHNMGRLFEKMNNYDKAIEKYKKLADGPIGNKDYYYDIMKAYIKLDNMGEAKKYYLKFVREANGHDPEYEQLFNL